MLKANIAFSVLRFVLPLCDHLGTLLSHHLPQTKRFVLVAHLHARDGSGFPLGCNHRLDPQDGGLLQHLDELLGQLLLDLDWLGDYQIPAVFFNFTQLLTFFVHINKLEIDNFPETVLGLRVQILDQAKYILIHLYKRCVCRINSGLIAHLKIFNLSE